NRVLAGGGAADRLFEPGVCAGVETLQGIARHAELGLRADALAGGERQRAPANRQGQRAAALARRPRQAARACVCGGRPGGHAVSTDDGGYAGGLQALTGQGVVTEVMGNAELVTVAAPLELALRV